MTENVAIQNQKSKIKNREYVHAKHEPVRRVLRWLITNIGFRWLAKLDRIEGLENLPPAGPAILMINHIAFIDPIVVLGNLPRNIVPMAKIEVYNYPVWGIFPRLWAVIPVRRGEADREALMQALTVLKAGEIILVAPQGTRQPALSQAKEGIAYLAHKSGAPIIPVAIEGTKGFPTISKKRWSEPGGVVTLGKPFRFKPITGRLPREALRQMTDEAMYRLAAMLPDHRRGIYSDLSKATSEYIE
ncbi:MAG: 1-acyl-sn-glycerol-3-phosphate acyltransferase [Chloroflexi bacterium]|nr:1-acyl-sn-glycerol-3-phosphate acyltransferase [Chloroflexota bacterium]